MQPGLDFFILFPLFCIRTIKKDIRLRSIEAARATGSDYEGGIFQWVDFLELHQKKTVYWNFFMGWITILILVREEEEWLRTVAESSAVRSII